jgi:hypothetical protein
MEEAKASLAATEAEARDLRAGLAEKGDALEATTAELADKSARLAHLEGALLFPPRASSPRAPLPCTTLPSEQRRGRAL